MSQKPKDIARVLISAEDIQTRVDEIAKQISQDYKADDGLYMIAILEGAFIFLSDLARRITVPHVVDFMAVSSYGRTAYSSGAVRFLMDLREPIEGRNVLVVEDIVDTGLTLNYLIEVLKARQPASIAVCSLLDRPALRLAEIPMKYVGFNVNEEFLVGYGLDCDERYRNLPDIYYLEE